jgi:hypothetical protein
VDNPVPCHPDCSDGTQEQGLPRRVVSPSTRWHAPSAGEDRHSDGLIGPREILPAPSGPLPALLGGGAVQEEMGQGFQGLGVAGGAGVRDAVPTL